MAKLRPYQKELFDLVYNETDHTLAVSPAGCLIGDTIVQINKRGNSRKYTLEQAYKRWNNLDKRYNWNIKEDAYTRSKVGDMIRLNKIENIVYSGVKPVYEITLENGYKLQATPEHKIWTKSGWVETKDLLGEEVAIDAEEYQKNFNQGKIGYSRCVNVKYVGEKKTYDICCKAPYHSFVANGIVVHNSGKSIVMAELINQYHKDHKTVLFMVHRNALLDQFKGHLTNYGNLKCDVLSPLKSLKTNKQYDIIFIDETHHATSPTFQKVFDKYPNARRVGFTATPVRLSGERLARPINKFRTAPFNKVFQTITIRELVAQKYLSDFDITTVDYTLFFNGKQFKTQGGEYSAKSISESFKDDKLPDTVERFINLAKGRKTIAYTSTIDMAEKLANELNKQGIKAKAFHSKLTPNQVDSYIEQFKKSKIEVCVNVDLFGEGFDVPDCDCVWMLRPTKSLSLYIQQFMRCMRIDPNNPSKRALIIDFANNVKTHGGLYTAELRMKLKEESTLLKICPMCETLNYAKIKVCDNPKCKHKFASGNGSLLKSTDPEEVKVGIKSTVVDYGINDEMVSIAKIDSRLINDITTKFIHRLCLVQLASKDKRFKSQLKQEAETPLFAHVKNVKPDLKVINLACEQFGFKQYDIDFFRNAYRHFKKWEQDLVAQQKIELEQKKGLARFYERTLLKPGISQQRKDKMLEWLNDFYETQKNY